MRTRGGGAGVPAGRGGGAGDPYADAPTAQPGDGFAFELDGFFQWSAGCWPDYTLR
jgi:hypothetical protein